MRLQPPDPLSTLLMWVSALFMAVKGGIDGIAAQAHRAPMIDLSGYWTFLPLALLMLAAIRQLFAGRIHSEVTESQRSLAEKVIEASKELAASRPAIPDPNAPRVFVPESFAKRYVEAVANRQTELQLDAMLRPHIGKWIRIEAPVFSVSLGYDGITVILKALPSEMQIMRASFNKKWSDDLVHVAPGTVVTIQSQIVDDGYQVRLTHSELL